MIRTLKKSFLLLLALVFIATLVCSCGADKTPAEATEAINSSDATNGSGDSTSYAVNTAVTPVETKAPQDGGDAPSTEVTNAIKEPKMGKLILVSKSETYYTLTVPENIAEDESAVVTEFASRLAELTGGDFHPYCESDFLLDLEIVIANGCRRRSYLRNRRIGRAHSRICRGRSSTFRGSCGIFGIGY